MTYSTVINYDNDLEDELLYLFMKKILLILMFFQFVVAGSLFAGVTVCGSCGWEVDSALPACGHCGAAVAVPDETGAAEPAEDTPVGEGSERVDALIPDLDVDAEIKLYRDTSGKGDMDLALLFLKNAAILSVLSPSAGDQKRSAAIAGMLAESEGRGILVDAKCAACGGTGKRMMRISSIIPGEDAKIREVEGSACPVCKGRGIVRRSGNLDDRKFALGRAESRFSTIQQGRNYRRVGRAWLPASAAERLSVKQAALVRSSWPVPCDKCLGAGRTDCPECDSAGVVDCPDCEGGNVFIKVEGTLVKGPISRSEKCKACKGIGVIACKKCSGTGGVLCKECSGRGDRPECGKCGAMGYTGCRKCGGTGRIEDAVCETCSGGGAVLCSTCNGEGRK